MNPLPNGRRAALDYGDSRIGVAISDFHRILCSPLPFIKNDEDIDKALIAIEAEYEPTYWVLGIPLHLSGEAGTSVEKVEAFAHRLQKLVAGEIFFMDERRTTLEAARKLHEAGVDTRRQKNLIDSLSAVALLEEAIHRESNPQGLGLQSFTERFS
jgi:putative Holliday junction resolvase